MNVLHKDSRVLALTDDAAADSYASTIRQVCAQHAIDPDRWRLDADAERGPTWIRPATFASTSSPPWTRAVSSMAYFMAGVTVSP